MRNHSRICAAAAAFAALAALASPASAKDAWRSGIDGYHGPGPGMGGPAEMDKALGVTMPIGAAPKSSAMSGDALTAEQHANCGETVTTTLDGSGAMVEHVTPKPCP